MKKVPLCSLRISNQIPTDDIEALKTALRISSIQTQERKERFIGVDDIIFILSIVSGLSAAANLVEKAIEVTKHEKEDKLAKEINSWRAKLRTKGIEPEGMLEHPDRPTLDLKTATDEEVEEWFKL